MLLKQVGWLSLWLLSSSAVVKADNSNHLASPIVQRQLETSVVAHSWPWTIHNVFCEAWASFQNTNNKNVEWDFMDALVESVLQLEEEKDLLVQEATNLVVQAAQKVPGTNVELLKYSLALRANSPLCEVHRGLARRQALESGIYKKHSTEEIKHAFAIVHPGEVLVTSPTRVQEALKEAMLSTSKTSTTAHETEPFLLSGEVPKNAKVQESTAIVILYGNMGTKEFGDLYLALSKTSVKLVVRHLGAIQHEEDGHGDATVLQGYGVRLDIRNVEYRAFDDDGQDDSEKEKVNLDQMETLLPNHVLLAGVNVSAMSSELSHKQALQLQQSLWKKHEAQQLHSQLIPPKWQRRQLPLQAAAAIVMQTKEDVLVSLMDVSQNLPSVASTLVHVPVPDKLQDLVTAMETSSTIHAAKSKAVLTINGKRVAIDRPSFNVFELLQLLSSEQAELQSMQQQLGPYMNPQALQQVYKAWMKGGDMENDNDEEDDDDEMSLPSSKKKIFRIDVGRGWKQAILYLNDIEKDQVYQQWPRQLQQMLFASQFGQPPAVRRNLYTMLAVMDPISQQENTGLTLGMQTHKSQYPVRSGVLFVNQVDLDKCAAWLASHDVPESDPCPVDPIFKESATPVDPSTLTEIQATTHMVHRITSQVLSMFSGVGVGTAYVEYLLAKMEQHMDGASSITVFDLLELHGQVIQGFQLMSSQEAKARALKTLQNEPKGDEPLYGKALRFAVERNLKPNMSFLNGRPLPTEKGADERAGQVFMEEQSYLFQLVMTQEINDVTPKSVYGMLLSGDTVYKRVHPLLTESSSSSYINLAQDNFGKEAIVFPKAHKGSSRGKDNAAVNVVDVVVDFNTDTGLDVASNMVSLLEELKLTIGESSDGDSDDEDDGTPVSVGYRFLPSTLESAASPLCPILAHAGLLDVPTLLELFQASKEGKDTTVDLLNSVKSIGSDVKKLVLSKEEPCMGFAYLEEELPSTNFLVANGRVYAPENVALTKDDLELLLTMDVSRTRQVTKLLNPHISQLDDAGYHDAVYRATSFLAKQQSGTQRLDIESELASLEQDLDIEENPFRFSWNDKVSDDNGLKVKVTAIVDPISEATQRLAPLLFVFRDELKLPLTLILAPPSSGGDEGYPITSYYRFVADPHATPDVNPARAYFDNLPTNHVLTLRMDVPEPWNVQQTYSVQDTDNLRCEVSGCGDDAHTGKVDMAVPVHERQHMTRVEYGLKDLLFFGQCYDATSGSPPNGLQLTLSDGSDMSMDSSETVEITPDGTVSSLASSADTSHYSDTLVMKTVGYWQLRATPGVWKLNIAKGSRGKEIFDMVDGTVQYGKIKVNPNNSSSTDGSTTKTLVMKDFVNSGELLLVKRRPGFESASLFYDDENNQEEEEEEVINVFSLATGHLYERFLKIMMLSVTKRTSTKVKFWLFENFLSPSFKATAMDMAAKIGCQVEFVTYKWPEWLRGQSEKQRIIWGYKILFLDVLFPLGVKKIIYVDADQVVRADLKELWHMDLQGAPYGYTPFCDSRESTLGFQFWRQGFWQSHLMGRPYHISALYVVDLEKFRRDLVGDQLRSFYQQLSADPNSLANLDQDLPNYAQHAVPIFSLPQEWLWCESWCSDETKATAKTVDLCNNPLHKEAKVSMAKRIISGELFDESWVELDAEVERYETEYLGSLGT